MIGSREEVAFIGGPLAGHRDYVYTNTVTIKIPDDAHSYHTYERQGDKKVFVWREHEAK